MADKTVIGVRYCGGCNPRFDRPALVNALAARCSHLILEPACAGFPYPAVVVVCGCPARCATVRDLAVRPDRLIRLDDPAQLEQAITQLACCLASAALEP